MITKALSLCLCCVVTAYCAAAHALPPLGLTPISSGATGLEIVNGVAYLSGAVGVQTVTGDGSVNSIPILHPTLGAPRTMTPVVEALDGLLYVAANFGTLSVPTGAALFRLDQPSTPLITWNFDFVVGVDRALRTFGNREDAFHNEATIFYLDGSTGVLPFPPGGDATNSSTSVSFVTPKGYSMGTAVIPNTAGDAPAVWAPNGEFTFLATIGDPDSIRDRSNSNGVNIGWNDFVIPRVSYGDGRNFAVFKEDGSWFYQDDPMVSFRVIVSHGDFAVVEVFESFSSGVSSLYGFFPGIVPGFPNRAVPLLDVFPELTSIDIDFIHDLASVDGYLYMTLSGSDGTFLFGARDPSVVPEPGAGVMMLLGAIVVWRRRPLTKRR